jgi:hypothetical protein
LNTVFDPNQGVRVRNPDGGGTVAATFIEPGAPDEAPQSGWVRIEEGERAGTLWLIPYTDIDSRRGTE